MSCRALLMLLGVIVMATTPALLAQDSADPAAVALSREKDALSLATAWLQSADPRVVAWGAHLALREQVRSALPDLVALVERESASDQPPSEERRHMQLALVDAVIQLGGAVSPEAARRLYTRYPVQTILLLTRAEAPAANAVLLDIVRTDRARHGTWLAAANLLARNRAPGFAAWALMNLTIRLEVQVTLDGARTPRGTFGSCPGGTLDTLGPLSVRAGWPPIGNYFLTSGGNDVLVAGADVTYYHRSLGPPLPGAAAGDISCSSPYSDRDALLARLLSRLAGLPSDFVEAEAIEPLQWRNDAQYRKEVLALVSRRLQRVDEIQGQLRSRGFVAEVEARDARVLLDVRVQDRRDSGLRPLPRITHQDPRIVLSQ